ncbi:hypothetical protein [Nonomuraea ferruginea]|uniref:Uncharacterized protein n=1 Tax=Nonomuraea ferruginea TaxID=46174 RepID=A0ABT4SY20_9ACTN|nr:hypothetical protein [Nonomuraea ferruginea]MDA0641883.1 hypothetical protein [Nonomuraea ferruginea]
MADQFDVIEAGERDRRRPIGLLVVLALLGASVAGLILSRGPDPAPEREPPREAAAPIRSLTRVDSRPNLLHPEADEKKGTARIEVTFPDGVRATVRYPAELRLDRLGLRPFQGVWVDDEFRQLTAPYNGELEITRGGEPIRSFGDNVTLWPRQAGSGSFGQVLLFAFGPWRMAMYDRPPGLGFDQRLAVASGVRGRVTGDGHLVLSGSGRVRLAAPGDTERGEPVGPQLWFGGGATDMVALIPTPGCEKARGLPRGVRGRGHPVADVCRDGMRVVAMGDDAFVGKALDGIRISVK